MLSTCRDKHWSFVVHKRKRGRGTLDLGVEIPLHEVDRRLQALVDASRLNNIFGSVFLFFKNFLDLKRILLYCLPSGIFTYAELFTVNVRVDTIVIGT